MYASAVNDLAQAIAGTAPRATPAEPPPFTSVSAAE